MLIEVFEHAVWTIERFRVGDDKPYNVSTIIGNIMLGVGIEQLWKLVAGTDADHYDNAHAEIGVGTGDAAEDRTHSGLQGGTKTYAGMEATFPQIGSDVDRCITFKSSFGDGVAEHDWKEFVVWNKSAGICLVRKVSDEGTKGSGLVWTVQLAITLG